MVVRLGMHAAFSAFAEISAWNYRRADRVEFQLPVHAMRVSRSEAITLRRVQATGGVGVGNPKGDQEALTRCRFTPRFLILDSSVFRGMPKLGDGRLTIYAACGRHKGTAVPGPVRSS